MNAFPELYVPPWTTNPQGDTRRVGVELEMNGMTLDRLAELAADHLGLAVERRGRHERALVGDEAGEWLVELDFDLLKRMGREEREAGTLAGDIGNSVEDLLAWFAETVVPLELVSPPLPFGRLEEVQALIAHLRRAGAKGTSDRVLNAFGMQFNPEIPSADVGVLLGIFKAFLCLYEWLYQRADIDMSRRVTSYIDPFPTEYVRKVVDPGYAPDLATLIDDYLEDNPTRNRALDLLPLFAFLDHARVRGSVDDVLIKARPTFHYRLPDCDIHVPGWGLHLAWNDWVAVERLAADPARLLACCAAYCEHLDNPVQRWLGDWAAETDRKWLAR